MSGNKEVRIIAFYGFKGGAGRSMLLANLVGLMAAQGKRVLVIDCDLEAPGLGDYLDRGNEAFASWRKKLGILDLLFDRSKYFDASDNPCHSNKEPSSGQPAADRENVFQRAFGEEGFLIPGNSDDFLIPVSGSGANGSIHLLGPGTHNAEVPYPQTYVSKLVDFDWNVFLNSDGGVFLEELGRAFKNQDYFDYVVIDGRTGYNFASVVLLQNWATDVVAVGTMAMQSIDGLARMMPIFSKAGIRCHVAISKMPQEVPDAALDGFSPNVEVDTETGIKRDLVRHWYNHRLKADVYEFPFLETFGYGDLDLWGRYLPEVMDSAALSEPIVTGDASPHPSDRKRRGHEEKLVRDYVNELERLYEGITGQDKVTDDDLKATFRLQRRDLSFALARANRTGAAIANGSNVSLDKAMQIGNTISAAGGGDQRSRIDANIAALLVRVEGYCLSFKEDKGARSTGKNAPKADVKLPDTNPVPSTNDAEGRDFSLAARDLARVKIAQQLEALSAKTDAYDPVRISEVKERNGLALLPVSVKDLPPPGAPHLPVEEGHRTNAADATWGAYGTTVRTPKDGGNKGRIQEARARLSARAQSHAGLSDALALADVIAEAYAVSDEDQRSLLTFGGRLLLSLDRPRFEALGEIATSTMDSLKKWNAFDAFLTYVPLALEVITKRTDTQVQEQLDQVQKKVVDRLQATVRQDNSAASRVQSLTFWGDYLRAALLCRRAVLTNKERLQNPGSDAEKVPPHALSDVLTRSEAAELLRCLGETSWEGYLEKPIQETQEELELAICLRLSIELMSLSGDLPSARQALRGLAGRFAEPGYPVGLTGVAEVTPDARQIMMLWALSILELARTAAALEGTAEAVYLFRLALRTYWPIRMDSKSNDDFVEYCAASLAVAVSRVGPPISEETIKELKTATNEAGYDWWAAAGYFSQGCYSQARELLNNTELDLKNRSVRVPLALLSWQYKCEASLCNIGDLAAVLESWSRLRPFDLSLLSDHNATWINLLLAHSAALMACGDNRKAIELLSTIQTFTEDGTVPPSDRHKLVISVRLKLAALRQVAELGTPIPKELAITFAEEAEEDVIEYISSLKSDLGLECDFAFCDYLKRAFPNQDTRGENYNGGGIFSGEDSLSPSRQKLAELLIEFVEILVYAERWEEARRMGTEIETDVLFGFDESERGSLATPARLAYCYPKAASLALRSATLPDSTEKTTLRDAAIRHRDADLAINVGANRKQYYDRVFSICQVE